MAIGRRVRRLINKLGKAAERDFDGRPPSCCGGTGHIGRKAGTGRMAKKRPIV